MPKLNLTSLLSGNVTRKLAGMYQHYQFNLKNHKTMKKPFTQTRTFFILFCFAFWILMFFAIPSKAAPKIKVKANKEFRHRKAINKAEQERIHGKTYVKKYRPAKIRKQCRAH